MDLKQVVVNNGGMSQDFSISKQDNKFSFENKNIRIQSTNDGTLLSVTNLKNPKQTSTVDIPCDIVYGSCITPDYLVLFCSYTRNNEVYDCIYRIDLAKVNGEYSCNVLYKEKKKNGTLGFISTSYFDTLYHEEGENVKKVYWTDGKHSPRFINVITPSERAGSSFSPYPSNVFEFYPNLQQGSLSDIPDINVVKNRNVESELPSGVIQYFISYYNSNGTETLIVNASDLYTIDYSNRGGKADETGMCAFDISIPASKVNTAFDYIRIYSAKRTVYDGPLTVNIVGDIKIDENYNGDYTIIDNGINQEQLQDSYIYFVGGTPFIAKTLTEKDDTAFFGNISTKNTLVPTGVKEAINENCFKDVAEGEDKQFVNENVLKFSLSKHIPSNNNAFGLKYPYALQLDGGSKTYKTFKSGEIYRFGIQFQTKQGQWTDVVWIGDAECTERPVYDAATESFIVNDVIFKLPEDVINVLPKDYQNYRILYADPENSNGRKIKAQGVVCPTMFTPGQRAQDAPYALPSWVMRPRKGSLAYHHFEPIFSSVVDGAEIAGYTPKKITDSNIEYTRPYFMGQTDENGRIPYLVTYLGVSKGNKLLVRCVKVMATPEEAANNFYSLDTGEQLENYEVLCDYLVPYGGNTNKFYDALRAIPKSGSKNNPYGYCGIEDSKYNYFQQDWTTSPPDKKPLSLIGALEVAELPIEWAMSPKMLGGISSNVAWGRTTQAESFLNILGDPYVSRGGLPPPQNLAHFYVGAHINDTYSTASGKLKDILNKGYIPLYGCSQGHMSEFTQRSYENNSTHTGSDYSTEDVISTYENKMFSTTKTTYSIMELYGGVANTSILRARYCTLPEIFRPRCTVMAPKSGIYDRVLISDDPVTYQYTLLEAIQRGIQAVEEEKWGTNGNISDADTYKHDAYNSNITSLTDDGLSYSQPDAEGKGTWKLKKPKWYDAIEGNWDYIEAFIQIIPFVDDEKKKMIDDSYNDYYVDESIVTLNSPDIDAINTNIDEIKFSIIGTAELNNCRPDFETKVNAYASAVLGGVATNTVATHINDTFNPLYSEFLYNDIVWDFPDGVSSGEEKDKKLKIDKSGTFETYLFAANNYLGVTSDSDLSLLTETFSEFPGIIEKQQIFNQYFSDSVSYFSKECDFNTVYCTVTDETGETKDLKINSGLGFYKPSYDNLIASDDTSHLYKTAGEDGLHNHVTLGSTRIKFSSTPHIVLNLQDRGIGNKAHKFILPHFKSEDTDYYRTIWDGKKYVWAQSIEGISNINVNTIFGENTDRGEWYQNALENLSTGYVQSIWDEDTRYSSSKDYFVPIMLLINLGASDSIEKTTIMQEMTNLLFVNPSEKSERIFADSYEEEESASGIYKLKDDYSIAKFTIGLFELKDVLVSQQSLSYIDTFFITKRLYISELTIANNTVVDIKMAMYPEVSSEHSGSYTYTDPQSQETVVIDYTYVEDTDYSDIYKNEATENKFRFKWWNKQYFDYASCHSGDNLIWPTQPQEGWPADMTTWTSFVDDNISEFPIKYDSPEIEDDFSSGDTPYVFIGEVYTDIANEDLYGGTDITNLRKLTWIPASKIFPIGNNEVSDMEGDTYYQRWDCLKTYPTTEEDVNQIVDITSFMVETHKNLDARTDSNRASYNIMSRPSNFNLFNDVYNQKNNIFEYAVRWGELASENTPNQIVWSMAKNYLGDVDTWTNINTSSGTRVDYPVTKLVNYNNTVLALTEHSLETVNFNTKQLIPSTDNSFIELQNSAKVDGTTKLQAPYGSYNMSTLITEKGLYFIEDNEKSLIRLGGEAGITKIGNTSLADWLKNNIVRGTYTAAFKEPFRLEYDSIHKDIYIINDALCIVYNEQLDSFISFVTYSGEYWLYNHVGNLYSYRHTDSKLDLYQMYSGDGYNKDFDDSLMEYSVWYRINPNAYSDKVFTNGTLAADCGVTNLPSMQPNSTKTSDIPFDTIQAWTEYQDTGEVPLLNILDRPSTLKQKFRFWRFDIPRDAKSYLKRDRIRNPWIHLKLKGRSDKKMEFHNLTIQYME